MLQMKFASSACVPTFMPCSHFLSASRLRQGAQETRPRTAPPGRSSEHSARRPVSRAIPFDHQARVDGSFYSGCRCSLALTARPSRISSAKLPARSTSPQISRRSARIPSIPETRMDRPSKPLASSLASSRSTPVEQMCLMLTPSSAAAISRRRTCRAAPAPGAALRRSGEQRPHLRCPLAAHSLVEKPSGSTRCSQRRFRSS